MPKNKDYKATAVTEFAEGLAAFMYRKHLTQTTLAQQLGISQPQVQLYTSGKVAPSLEKLRQLYELGMNSSEIFGGAARQNAETTPKELSLTNEQCRRIVELGMAEAGYSLQLVVAQKK